jgi:DNA-3-methyladenine glycosylase I
MHGDGEWKPPEWWYRNKRPASDEAYFENLTRVIFQAGLNWQVIDKKWPTTVKAFEHFNIGKVAAFTNKDVERLLKDEGIVRNKAKICATITNAVQFLETKKQYGSFQKYLDSLDKSKNYATVVNDLTKRFKFLGPSSAGTFLYTVGEKFDPWEEHDERVKAAEAASR